MGGDTSAPGERRQTVADRLRRARGRRFVGRAEELRLFRSALAAPGTSFTVQPTGAAFVAALGAALGLADDASPLDELAGRKRPVLLLDTYELLAPLDDWLREQLLPALPGDAVVVIAGRTTPSSRWLSDPGWHELLKVVSVRNLRPEDTRSYLRIEGVREACTSRC